MKYSRYTLSISLFLIIILLNTLHIQGWEHREVHTGWYDNTPPDSPYIEGPTTCNITEKIQYFITITDPDGDRLVELLVRFGDGTNETIKYRGSSCTKGWRSGTTLTIGHRWIKPNDYTIKAKVKDYSRDWSEWGFFDVHVTTNKPDNMGSLFSLFLNIIKGRDHQLTSWLSN